MTIRTLKKFWPATIALLIVVVYQPLLGQRTFSPDAHIILPPLFDASIGDYLRMLMNFEVVDFQPVRDLTFFADIFFYRRLGIITFSATNVLLWTLSCVQIFTLIRRSVPGISILSNLLVVSAFSVYPLFSQAVAWTMARKHVLALTLILLTTHLFLDWLTGKRKWFPCYIAYVAAVLSHPIVILWPCWAIVHYRLVFRRPLRDGKSAGGIFLLTMFALLLTNYSYYVVLSPRLHEYYTEARPKFSFSRVLLHWGSYWKQLLWPYELTFTYFPRVTESWPGWVISGGVFLFAWIQRHNAGILSWLVFALFPFPVFIGISVYDQYLLLSATGVLLALVNWRPSFGRTAAVFLAASVLFWGYRSFQEASRWTEKGEISIRNFENEPSCRSAIELINSVSQLKHGMPDSALNFFREEGCFSVLPQLPPAEKPKAIVAQSLFLFYRAERIGVEQVTQELRALGAAHYFPLLLYCVLLTRSGNVEEVDRATRFIFTRTKGPVEESGPIITDTLLPFCRAHRLESCLELLKKHERSMPPYF